jgi:hypothetical protein
MHKFDSYSSGCPGKVVKTCSKPRRLDAIDKVAERGIPARFGRRRALPRALPPKRNDSSGNFGFAAPPDSLAGTPESAFGPARNIWTCHRGPSQVQAGLRLGHGVPLYCSSIAPLLFLYCSSCFPVVHAGPCPGTSPVGAPGAESTAYRRPSLSRHSTTSRSASPAPAKPPPRPRRPRRRPDANLGGRASPQALTFPGGPRSLGSRGRSPSPKRRVIKTRLRELTLDADS